jgi:hypothetical protein
MNTFPKQYMFQADPIVAVHLSLLFLYVSLLFDSLFLVSLPPCLSPFSLPYWYLSSLYISSLSLFPPCLSQLLYLLVSITSSLFHFSLLFVSVFLVYHLFVSLLLVSPLFIFLLLVSPSVFPFSLANIPPLTLSPFSSPSPVFHRPIFLFSLCSLLTYFLSRCLSISVFKHLPCLSIRYFYPFVCFLFPYNCPSVEYMFHTHFY